MTAVPPSPLPGEQGYDERGLLVNRFPYRPGGPLGIIAIPVAVSAVDSVIKTFTGIFGGKAVDSEKSIASSLESMANAGNLTAFTAILSRGQIKTQGYADLYNPIIARLEASHQDWYDQAYQMLQPGNIPGGKPFWSYPQNQVLSAVATYSKYATGTPGNTTIPSGGGTVAAMTAGFGSWVWIAAIAGAVLVMRKRR